MLLSPGRPRKFPIIEHNYGSNSVVESLTAEQEEMKRKEEETMRIASKFGASQSMFTSLRMKIVWSDCPSFISALHQTLGLCYFSYFP